MPITRVRVDQVKKGDRFMHNGLVQWIAQEDAAPTTGGFDIKIRVCHHPDGGIEDRKWDRSDMPMLTVDRPRSTDA